MAEMRQASRLAGSQGCRTSDKVVTNGVACAASASYTEFSVAITRESSMSVSCSRSSPWCMAVLSSRALPRVIHPVLMLLCDTEEN